VREAILELRRSKNIGARRIQIELGFTRDLWLSRTIIQRTLDRAGVKPLKRPRRPEKPKRYNRPVPGDRVQMDTMKIARGVYQYTAVDDCSRFRVLGLYPRRAGKCTIAFLERVIEEMPFPIQRVQTDRGTEFFAEQVQRFLKLNFIKFRPIPPRSPHLNGKVERSQGTDLQEFWANRNSPSLADAQDLECWQFDYNWRRPHGSLRGRRPVDRLAEVTDRIPDREQIALKFDETREPLRFSNWAADTAMKALRQLREARDKRPENG
jgi:transposase InsO family protein